MGQARGSVSLGLRSWFEGDTEVSPRPHGRCHLGLDGRRETASRPSSHISDSPRGSTCGDAGLQGPGVDACSLASAWRRAAAPSLQEPLPSRKSLYSHLRVVAWCCLSSHKPRASLRGLRLAPGRGCSPRAPVRGLLWLRPLVCSAGMVFYIYIYIFILKELPRGETKKEIVYPLVHSSAGRSGRL